MRRVPSLSRLRPDATAPLKPKEPEAPRTWLTVEELKRFDKVKPQLTLFRMMECRNQKCRRDIPKDAKIIYCSRECAEPAKKEKKK